MKPIPDVCIVGAGPVGSFLACLLGTAGARVHICEQRLHPPELSMAIGIMPPTLRRMESIGLAGELVNAGCPVQSAWLHSATRCLGKLKFDNLPPPYPFILTLPQAQLVAALWERLKSLPEVTFETGTRVESITQHTGSAAVRVQTERNGMRHTLDSKFVMVCEGARGVLRNTIGLDTPPRPYDRSFVMGTAADETEWNREAHLFFTATGSLESFPLPGRQRRWVAQVMPEQQHQPDNAAYLSHRVHAIAGIHLPVEDLHEVTSFVPQHRLARCYHAGRIILCGDAAHVMSPIGGQGMNIGLGDAWHAAAVWRACRREHSASGRLLNDYSEARRRACRIATRRAAWGMRFGTLRGQSVSAMRAGIIRHLLLHRRMTPRLARVFSMITIPDGNPPPIAP